MQTFKVVSSLGLMCLASACATQSAQYPDCSTEFLAQVDHYSALTLSQEWPQVEERPEWYREQAEKYQSTLSEMQEVQSQERCVLYSYSVLDPSTDLFLSLSHERITEHVKRLNEAIQYLNLLAVFSETTGIVLPDHFLPRAEFANFDHAYAQTEQSQKISQAELIQILRDFKVKLDYLYINSVIILYSHIGVLRGNVTSYLEWLEEGGRGNESKDSSFGNTSTKPTEEDDRQRNQTQRDAALAQYGSFERVKILLFGQCGLSLAATDQQVQSGCRRKMRELHPDQVSRDAGLTSDQKNQKLKELYQLNDLKAAYDCLKPKPTIQHIQSKELPSDSPSNVKLLLDQT